jgi:anti-sigma B factor antagonist
MSRPAQASYMVARIEQTVYIRSLGLANMKSAPMLDVFLRSECEQGATTACVDLSSCNGMDSTFMGMLVGHAKSYEGLGGRLVIVNPSPTNLRLLAMLGVTVVIPVVENQHLPEMEFVSLTPDPKMNAVQRMQMVKRAHENLVRLNAANKDKFTAFLTALEADLKKLRHL